MFLRRFFLYSVCLASSLSLAAPVFSQADSGMTTTRSTTTSETTSQTTSSPSSSTTTSTTTTTMQPMDPAMRGTVNADVIDSDSPAYHERIDIMAARPAPQSGQTRAAVEAVYGPSKEAYAPNQPYDIYTNERDLVEGRMFKRRLDPEALRVYQVTWNNTNNFGSPNDQVSEVRERVIPAIGDHKNLVVKLLGKPMNRPGEQGGQRLVFTIPKERFVHYNDVISSPYTAVNTYFDSNGFLIGQEFLPSRMQGGYAITSAGRYIEVPNKMQPDRKVGN